MNPSPRVCRTRDRTRCTSASDGAATPLSGRSTMKRLLAAIFTFAIFAAACSSGGGSNSSSPIDTNASHAPVTITVWDYYGKATPFQDSAIQKFETQYPWITVDHQALGYDSLQQKFTVAVSSQAPPGPGDHRHDLAAHHGVERPLHEPHGPLGRAAQRPAHRERVSARGPGRDEVQRPIHHDDVRLRRVRALLPRRPLRSRRASRSPRPGTR